MVKSQAFGAEDMAAYCGVFLRSRQRGCDHGGLGSALAFGLMVSVTPRSPSNASRSVHETGNVTEPSHLCNAKMAIAVWPN
jgi:hypothetical protein